MKGKRLRQTIHMYLTLNPHKRTKYLRDNHIFASMGENCSIMDRKIPLYANLIKLGNNVHIASKVDFIVHDIAHIVLNGTGRPQNVAGGGTVKEKIGCVEIGNNVFVGSNTTILQNVRIGNNVIIGAGTLVNKDIPDNSVAVGVPAKVIGSFDNYLEKRSKEHTYPDQFRVSGEAVDSKFAEWLWSDFYKQRQEG